MLTVPGRCWLCAMPLRLSHWGVCSCCTATLLPAPHACPQCGLPAFWAHTPCGRCLQRPPPWERLVFISDYQPPLSRLVRQLKFNGVTALAPALARLLALSVLQARRERQLVLPEWVVAVPLHRRRGWRRGFNQSQLLAERTARLLGCGFAPGAVLRQRATPVQHRLSAASRRCNLKNAFRLEFAVAGRHIAIVDDVVTTGSTVAEIARLLKCHGAATVQVWCLCRTL